MAHGAANDDVLPDLVADSVERPQLQTYTQTDGDHLLLRFDGFVHNAGPGALELRGSNRNGTEMKTVIQRIYKENGTFNTTDTDLTRSPQFKWEPADGHNHWHLKNIARYSLWNAAKSAEVGVSQKVGFCLSDSDPVEDQGTDPGYYAIDNPDLRNCQAPGAPFNGAGATASNVMVGISPGWRDMYVRSLAFQYVDVTDTQPGSYWIRSEADPNDVVREANESNPGAFYYHAITVPGYQALPVARGTILPNEPASITLDASAFQPFDTTYQTALGARQFKITEGPKHGTLSRATGTSFTSATLTYTPKSGYLGADSFKYVALDSSSAYPKHPVTATVALNVAGQIPSVAISGTPASVVAGKSAQLSAIVQGDKPGVTWSVEGIPGGNFSVGTITPDGLYVAPHTVPLTGSVKIRATSASGAFDEETVTIVAPAVQLPAPLATTPATARSGTIIGSERRARRALTSLKLGRSGRWLLIGVRSSKTGIVRTYATKGWSLIGFCRTKATANRPLTCKILIPRGVSASKIEVQLTLRVNGKLVESLKTDLAAAKKRVTTSGGHQHHH